MEGLVTLLTNVLWYRLSSPNGPILCRAYVFGCCKSSYSSAKVRYSALCSCQQHRGSTHLPVNPGHWAKQTWGWFENRRGRNSMAVINGVSFCSLPSPEPPPDSPQAYASKRPVGGQVAYPEVRKNIFAYFFWMVQSLPTHHWMQRVLLRHGSIQKRWDISKLQSTKPCAPVTRVSLYNAAQWFAGNSCF